mgnify:CR=1 FL=1
MLPYRKSIYRILIHASFWMIWGILYYPNSSKGFISVLFNFLSMAPASYLAIYFIIKELRTGRLAKNPARALPIWIGAGLLYVAIDIGLDYVFFSYTPESFSKLVYGHSFSFFFVVSVPISLELFLHLLANGEEVRLLQQKRHEVEMEILKSQVKPHFLFNTLNNIYALSMVDPPKVGAAILGLSNLMRYLLTDSQQKRVQLSAELQYILDYVELERMRLPNPDCVKLSVIRSTSKDFTVPPLLLLPLVENIFKHAHLDAEVSASIIIEVSEKQLRFVSHNKKRPVVAVEQDRVSTGLSNLRSRLEYVCSKSSLEIKETEEDFDVYFELEWNAIAN